MTNIFIDDDLCQQSSSGDGFFNSLDGSVPISTPRSDALAYLERKNLFTKSSPGVYSRNTDIALGKTILDQVITIQKLPEEDKTHIMYSLDGLIQHARTRIAYK